MNGDYLAQGGLVRAQQGGRGVDFHALNLRADFEVDINAGSKIQLEIDASDSLRLETLRLNRDGIFTRVEERKAVIAATGGDLLSPCTGLHLKQRYLGARHYGAAGIGYSPQNRCGGCLGVQSQKTAERIRKN